MAIKLTIPGAPIPQKRHQHRRLTDGRIIVYDPNAREKAVIKQEIKAVLSNQYKNFEPYTIPAITYYFFMPLPKFLSKKQRDDAENEKLRHLVKPDVDNLVKLYTDCLLKLVIKDDNSVIIDGAYKIYSKNPRVELIIRQAPQLVEPDNIRHIPISELSIGELPTLTMEVPPYSECPRYSACPQLLDN